MVEHDDGDDLGTSSVALAWEEVMIYNRVQEITNMGISSGESER